MNKKIAATKKVAAKVISQKHTGKIARAIRVSALEAVQLSTKLYVFKAKASILFEALSINRKIEDKDEGYQRTLSLS